MSHESNREISSASLGGAGQPVLTATEVGHEFGEHRVLGSVSLALYPGQIYVLLGSNGAGKTTMLRAVSGLKKPTFGRIELNGKDVFADAAQRRLISYVPQNIAIFEHLTVKENLRVFGRFAGQTGHALDRAVSALLDAARLGDYADRMSHQLSGGYRRRVNICIGMISEPRVLVLDEPTVGIDVDARDAIHALLDEFRHRGVAMLLTTHDFDQAQALADRIGILSQGAMVCQGNPGELIAETFGNQQEIIIDLRSAPRTGGIRELQRQGFRQAHSSVNWVGYIDASIVDPREMNATLSQAGLNIRELRLRSPSLESLFMQTIQRGA